MKIAKAIWLLTLICPRLVSAQFASNAHLQSDAALHDVHFVTHQLGWSVGDRGTILHTSDGGQTWKQQMAPFDGTLNSVYFLDEQIGWAVGESPLPYMKRGRGVILRTDNGGRTWLRERVDTLPALRKVYFQSSKRGFAVGDGSPLFPSGAFFSGDGRSWNPVAVQGLAGWVAATFQKDGTGLFLSPQGKITRCSGAQSICVSARTPLPKQRMRDIAWAGDQQAWAVGDQGTLWLSTDGGQSWSDYSERLPKGVATGELDFATICCRGSSVWIGGLPGSKILHSPNGGRNWQVQLLPSTTPLNKIQFTSSKHGVAVGELGIIHITDDGGQTWITKRGAGRRLFALGVFRRADRIPWMACADLAGRGARVQTFVLDSSLDDPLTTSLANRVHHATIAAGGHGGDVWSSASDRRLATLIQCWQPDVIVTDSISAQSIKQLVDALPDRSTRVWAMTTNPAAKERLSANQLAGPLGQSLGTLSNQASSMIVGRYSGGNDSIAFQSLVGGGKLSTGISPSNHNARENSVAADPSDRRMAQKQSALRSLLSKAADSNPNAKDANAWLAQIENMVAEMPQTVAATTLYELAHLHLSAGNPTAGLTVLESLTAKYPQVPISTAAVRDAITWVASAELQKHAAARSLRSATVLSTARANSTTEKESPPAAKDSNSPFQFAGSVQPKTPEQIRAERGLLREEIRRPQFSAGRDLSLNDVIKVAATNSNPVQTLAKNVGQTPTRQVDVWNMATWSGRITPMLKSEPKLQFAIESHRRRTTSAGVRQKAVYQRLARASATIQYRRCGDQELQFLEPQRQSPKSSHSCPLTAKPLLDGKLDDPAWQQSTPIELESRFPQAPATRIWLARGESHLYIAAESDRIFPMTTTTQEPRTTRDLDLNHWDRLELWLDVNRDYSTAWRLVVDERGQVADDVQGVRTWDPRWFVANRAQDNSWTIEAAIPLSELLANGSEAKSPWAIGIQRIIPGAVRMQWPAEFNGDALESSGILLFE